MAHEITAKLSNCGTSAQKARLVVDLVRGKKVVDALNILGLTPNGVAAPLRKLIASAMANAEENFGVGRDELVVYKIYADEGPTRKWRTFGARGRFKPQLRRSSEITVILREIE
ncbi:MAG: 50S ribosomal protein L22 [Anaerolineaceae bacterium]|nr:50S ribosomal protein L22 [Anaerolineaceae bacterium]